MKDVEVALNAIAQKREQQNANVKKVRESFTEITKRFLPMNNLMCLISRTCCLLT